MGGNGAAPRGLATMAGGGGRRKKVEGGGMPGEGSWRSVG